MGKFQNDKVILHRNGGENGKGKKEVLKKRSQKPPQGNKYEWRENWSREGEGKKLTCE